MPVSPLIQEQREIVRGVLSAEEALVQGLEDERRRFESAAAGAKQALADARREAAARLEARRKQNIADHEAAKRRVGETLTQEQVLATERLAETWKQADAQLYRANNYLFHAGADLSQRGREYLGDRQFHEARSPALRWGAETRPKYDPVVENADSAFEQTIERAEAAKIALDELRLPSKRRTIGVLALLVVVGLGALTISMISVSFPAAILTCWLVAMMLPMFFLVRKIERAPKLRYRELGEAIIEARRLLPACKRKLELNRDRELAAAQVRHEQALAAAQSAHENADLKTDDEHARTVAAAEENERQATAANDEQRASRDRTLADEYTRVMPDLDARARGYFRTRIRSPRRGRMETPGKPGPRPTSSHRWPDSGHCT